MAAAAAGAPCAPTSIAGAGRIFHLSEEEVKQLQVSALSCSLSSGRHCGSVSPACRAYEHVDTVFEGLSGPSWGPVPLNTLNVCKLSVKPPTCLGALAWLSVPVTFSAAHCPPVTALCGQLPSKRNSY